MPAYGGTLAAARCLGEHGVSVTMAGDTLLAPARWSRYVTRWERCPPVLDAERFYDWLIAFGEREPGHVLYPTCDDLAWLFADRRDELKRYYRLYEPSVDAVIALLDKKHLCELATKLGIDTLPTAFPANDDETHRYASDIGYPFLLKPRTQIFLPTRCKGFFVGSPAELPGELARFAAENAFYAPLVRRVSGIDYPMLQTFRSDAAENIYSISGFIGQSDHEIVARAAVKVLQRPRRLGVGLCFEEAPVDQDTLAGLVRMSREVGYFGVFEAEFVRVEGRPHLIDFNPRFYGQMGFETARSLPLAYLTWLAALGRTSELGDELQRAKEFQSGKGYVYCNRFFFNVLLSLQQLGGRMSSQEANRWRSWLRSSSERELAFDSVDAPDDRMPAVAAAVRDVYLAARHPRSFLRQMVIGP
jgi:predicted ATP-grasp superfamily ATP-dependent carboligase